MKSDTQLIWEAYSESSDGVVQDAIEYLSGLLSAGTISKEDLAVALNECIKRGVYNEEDAEQIFTGALASATPPPQKPNILQRLVKLAHGRS